MLITVVVTVPVSLKGHISCLVSSSPLSSRNIQAHEKPPTCHMGLALSANHEGKERVRGKASRMQSIRIGFGLVCVRQSTEYHALKLPDPTQSVLITVVMVAVSSNGPTGCPVRPPLLSSQNISRTKNLPQAIGPGVKQRP